jgi:hypothetical protein
MKEAVARKVVRRKDYTPYPWEIDQLCLRFDIDRRITTVKAEIQFSRLDQAG